MTTEYYIPPAIRPAPLTHRQLYPNQYTHPLVGKTVEITFDDWKTYSHKGKVLRVCNTSFGPLVILEGDRGQAYDIFRCRVVDVCTEETPCKS